MTATDLIHVIQVQDDPPLGRNGHAGKTRAGPPGMTGIFSWLANLGPGNLFHRFGPDGTIRPVAMFRRIVGIGDQIDQIIGKTLLADDSDQGFFYLSSIFYSKARVPNKIITNFFSMRKVSSLLMKNRHPIHLDL